ncbi:hypothetical protein PI125_g931 [Phytophthora idaei]|nr:hypothetical protein PI125_g931 [Phytophthora idaei]KAG3173777.1 hypothetical protein PI126_g688 [Phytophthora idaei]
MSPGRTNYAKSFSRWSLHDCSGVEDALSEEEMRTWFARWRATRGKLVTETHSVTRQSLDQAWTAFVSRWNAETGPRFRQLIESREPTFGGGACDENLRLVVECRAYVLLRTLSGGVFLLSRV